jgi:hypothetical protein
MSIKEKVRQVHENIIYGPVNSRLRPITPKRLKEIKNYLGDQLNNN